MKTNPQLNLSAEHGVRRLVAAAVWDQSVSQSEIEKVSKKAALLLLVTSILVSLTIGCEDKAPTPTVATIVSSDTPALLDPERAALVEALKNLQRAMLRKLDYDIQNTAGAFTSVQDVWRWKRWADIATVPLEVVRGLVETVTTVTDLLELHKVIDKELRAAKGTADLLMLANMVHGIWKAGEQLQYGLYGPPYVQSIKEMLEAADATVAPGDFDHNHHRRVIENHIMGTQGDPVVKVPRHSTQPERYVVEYTNDALRTKTSIKRTFDALIAEIEAQEPPEHFPVDRIIAQLEYLEERVRQSMGRSITLEYETVFAGCSEPARASTTLGTVAGLYSVWSMVAGDLASKLDIEIKVEMIQTANSILAAFNYKLGSETLEVAEQVLTLTTVIAEPYTARFSIEPEQAFYMMPQEMLFALPVEFSNLWMIADDTDQYLRCLLEGLPATPTFTPTATSTSTAPSSSTPTLTPTATSTSTPTPSSTPTSTPTLAPTPRASAGIVAYDNGGIWVIRGDGTENRLLIPRGYHPLWLPDCQGIAYTTWEGEIKILLFDGTGAETIWQTPWNPYGVPQILRTKWSHDGKGLFVQWHQTTGGMPFPWDRLKYIDLATSAEIELFQGVVHSDQSTWPIVAQFDIAGSNGQIVFVELVDPDWPSWTEALSIADKDGTNKRRLFTAEADALRESMEMAGSLIRAPEWSPDGELIAFYLSKPVAPLDEATLCIIHADGSNLRELRQVRLDPLYSWIWNGDIAWSPDGKEIAYVDNASIWIVSSDGSGEPRRLVEGRSPAWCVASAMPVLTPSP